MNEAILVDESDMAKRLGLSVSYLQKDRRGSRAIPFVRLGKLVRYNPAAVLAAMTALQQGGASTHRQKGNQK